MLDYIFCNLCTWLLFNNTTGMYYLKIIHKILRAPHVPHQTTPRFCHFNNMLCRHRLWILCLRFRSSLIYINNCPTRCNTKQSIYYSSSSLYTFRVSTTPIIRSTKKLAWPRQREVAAQKIWPVPEAVVTALCTPDNRYVWHPKHVEWTCIIINRVLCVASRWTIINTGYEVSHYAVYPIPSLLFLYYVLQYPVVKYL